MKPNHSHGLILCVRHARQWAHDEPFSGDCHPVSAWIGGYGQTVICDAVGPQADDCIHGPGRALCGHPDCVGGYAEEQHFDLAITPPSDDDRDEVDAEQVGRWVAEAMAQHRPRHTITVREVTPWDNGPRHCPDDGCCHHGCTIGCWRVANCGPLGAEEWDPMTVAAYSRNDGRL